MLLLDSCSVDCCCSFIHLGMLAFAAAVAVAGVGDAMSLSCSLLVIIFGF